MESTSWVVFIFQKMENLSTSSIIILAFNKKSKISQESDFPKQWLKNKFFMKRLL